MPVRPVLQLPAACQAASEPCSVLTGAQADTRMNARAGTSTLCYLGKVFPAQLQSLHGKEWITYASQADST